ncbi:hypothetical protein [Leptospira ainazelensis]|uniref:hypothetical protein n=1 Tax=Leptospira ainazelensis TaxID=2810034 RepID=UPI001963320B|nr:hypothetical protein [Leptospira ainazelensis]
MDQSKESLMVVRDSILILVIVLVFLATIELFSRSLSRAPIEKPKPFYVGKESIYEKDFKKSVTECFLKTFKEKSGE